MSLGTYRPVQRIQPGWLINCEADTWMEVRAVLDFDSGRRDVVFVDGSKAHIPPHTEVRCITNAEKRDRRVALMIGSLPQSEGETP